MRTHFDLTADASGPGAIREPTDQPNLSPASARRERADHTERDEQPGKSWAAIDAPTGALRSRA